MPVGHVVDKVGHAIAKGVLDHRAHDGDLACHGLVAVDSVGEADRGHRHDQDTAEPKAHHHDHRPRPLMLPAQPCDEQADEADDAERDQSGQAHLGLADPPVAHRQSHGDPVRERARRQQAHDATAHEREIDEADGRGTEVVGGRGKPGRLQQIQHQQAVGAEAQAAGAEEHDGEGHELERRDQVARQEFQLCSVRS